MFLKRSRLGFGRSGLVVIFFLAITSIGCGGSAVEKAADVTNEATDGVDEGQYANGGQVDRIAAD